MSDEGDFDAERACKRAVPLLEQVASDAIHRSAQTRLELITTEVQEEIQRATVLLIWGSIALLSAGIGVFFVGITIILAFWDTHLPAGGLRRDGRGTGHLRDFARDPVGQDPRTSSLAERYAY